MKRDEKPCASEYRLRKVFLLWLSGEHGLVAAPRAKVALLWVIHPEL